MTPTKRLIEILTKDKTVLILFRDLEGQIILNILQVSIGCLLFVVVAVIAVLSIVFPHLKTCFCCFVDIPWPKNRVISLRRGGCRGKAFPLKLLLVPNH